MKPEHGAPYPDINLPVSAWGRLTRKQFMQLLFLGAGSVAIAACRKQISESPLPTGTPSGIGFETGTPYPPTATPTPESLEKQDATTATPSPTATKERVIDTPTPSPASDTATPTPVNEFSLVTLAELEQNILASPEEMLQKYQTKPIVTPDDFAENVQTETEASFRSTVIALDNNLPFIAGINGLIVPTALKGTFEKIQPQLRKLTDVLYEDRAPDGSVMYRSADGVTARNDHPELYGTIDIRAFPDGTTGLFVRKWDMLRAVLPQGTTGLDGWNFTPNELSDVYALPGQTFLNGELIIAGANQNAWTIVQRNTNGDIAVGGRQGNVEDVSSVWTKTDGTTLITKPEERSGDPAGRDLTAWEKRDLDIPTDAIAIELSGLVENIPVKVVLITDRGVSQEIQKLSGGDAVRLNQNIDNPLSRLLSGTLVGHYRGYLGDKAEQVVGLSGSIDTYHQYLESLEATYTFEQYLADLASGNDMSYKIWCNDVASLVSVNPRRPLHFAWVYNETESKMGAPSVQTVDVYQKVGFSLLPNNGTRLLGLLSQKTFDFNAEKSVKIWKMDVRSGGRLISALHGLGEMSSIQVSKLGLSHEDSSWQQILDLFYDDPKNPTQVLFSISP